MEHSRRDLLTGAAAQRELAARQDALAESATALFPDATGSVALRIVAMACDFEAFAPSGPNAPVGALSRALDEIPQVESRISVYRDDSELSRVNRDARAGWTTVEPDVFAWLDEARRFSTDLDGAFDPTTGPLVALWRHCRREQRLPISEELEAALKLVGLDKVEWDVPTHRLRFLADGMSLNLNAFGKGSALDLAAARLDEEQVASYCLHAGHSSILARGSSVATAASPGWTISISNPLLAHHRLARLRLSDAGMSTSGNGVQYFTLEGRRYGHLLNPRTGWPAEGLLSVSVIASTAAEAEALSTAFFVMGAEKACGYCQRRHRFGASPIGAILVPPPVGGRLLSPVVVGLSRESVVFDADEVAEVVWMNNPTA